MGAFRFAHQLLRGAAVTGTIDATYQNAWLVDGSPGTPVQTTGDLALAVTPVGATNMDVFALVNHTVSVTAALTGSVTGTIPVAPLSGEDIRYNSFLRLTSPVAVSTAINLSITGNSGPIVVGEFFGGLSFALDPYELDLDPGEAFPWEAEFASIAPYDPGLSHPRRLSGEVVLDSDGYAAIRAWYEATRRGTRPSLVIPDDAVNDAWLAIFQYQHHYEDTLHFVTLEVIELPRTRW